MNGPKKTYEEYMCSLDSMQEPTVPKTRIDMRGAMEYAKNIGVSIESLSKKEKSRFIQYIQ